MRTGLYVSLLGMVISSSFAFADLEDELALMASEHENKNKPISYYKEMAEREQSITKAAVAIRERLDAGVSLKDDGTWDIKPQRKVQTQIAPQQVNSTSLDLLSAPSGKSNVELGGIAFGGTAESEYRVKHVIGDHATLVVGGQEYRVKQGDKLETGDTVLSVTLHAVKLMTYEGSEFTVKSKI